MGYIIIIIQLFQSYIDPILLYNAENQTAMTDRQIEKCKQDQAYIYTLCNESPLTTTQLKFTKFVLGLGKHCPNMSIFGESAALPLLTRAHIHMRFKIQEIQDSIYFSDRHIIKKYIKTSS